MKDIFPPIFLAIFAAIVSLIVLGACYLVYQFLKKTSSNVKNTISDVSQLKEKLSKQVNNSTTKTSFSSTSSYQNENSFIYPDASSYPRIHVYKIRGINPQTNRQKSESVVALENTPIEIIASKTNLLPPYSLSLDLKARIECPPSEAQLDLAQKLHISIPPICSMADVSCLIDRYFNNIQGDYITPELYAFLGSNNIDISPYITPELGVSLALHYFDGIPCLVFFSYFVYCLVRGRWYLTTPELSPYKDVFENFGREYASNSSLIEIVHSLSYEHICYMRSHGNVDKRSKKNAAAFSLTYNYLNSHIPYQTSSNWEKWKDIHGDPEQIKRQCRAYDKRLSPLSLSEEKCSAIFQGLSWKQYKTTLSSCSCPDFVHRQKPCKHMYRLAYELRNRR